MIKNNKNIKIILFSFGVASFLIGCGGGSGNSSVSTSASSSNTVKSNQVINSDVLKITQDTYASNIKFEWTRTGTVLKYNIYSQLEFNDTVIATTNNSNVITIDCVKQTITWNKISYKCTADNTSMQRDIDINKSGFNLIKERGGVVTTDETVNLVKLYEIATSNNYVVEYQ